MQRAGPRMQAAAPSANSIGALVRHERALQDRICTDRPGLLSKGQGSSSSSFSGYSREGRHHSLPAHAPLPLSMLTSVARHGSLVLID